MASPAPEVTEPRVVFRPGKKRKIYRQRSEDADGETAEVANETSAGASGLRAGSSSTLETRDPRHPGSEEEELSVAEVLRRRNAQKARLGGVAFRATPTPRNDDAGATEDGNPGQSLTLPEGGGNAVDSIAEGGIVKRFATQTGLVGELVNRHMEEYIESELARRQRHANEYAAAQAQAQANSHQHSEETVHDKPVVMQPAMRGKLLEIDLGEEARARNIAMTERARRRLEGQSIDEEEEGAGQRPRKVRLGKDGKPLRQRGRRGSDDIKRDQLVEEFLRENRLDVYDIPAQNDASSAALGGDEAADDRIAEEFRRDFMDALSARRQRRRPATNAPPKPPKGTVKKEEILRGPKLGGSRNVRSQMRDLLLKEQMEKR